MRLGIYFENYSPQVGGTYTYLADLLFEIGKITNISEHQVTIFYDSTSSGAMPLTIKAANIKIVTVRKPSRLLVWLKFSLMRFFKFSPLARYMRRWRGPLERAAREHEIQLLWFIVGTNYECPDIPFIATILDLQQRVQPFFPEVGSREVWDARENFFKYSIQRSAYCITGTVTGKLEIENMYQVPKERVRVLPLPVPSFARYAPPTNIDIRSHFGIIGEYVFYPAQFWPHKNHINLILAIRWLKLEKNVDIKLVLTGVDKGNLLYVKEFVKSQGLDKQVLFLGFVTEHEMIALYRQALALTFITYFGPDNIPPLEAFALGCPVIASSVSGSEEQLGENVILVQPSEPVSIGNAIWRLHSDAPFREKLIKAGIERAGKWTAAEYIAGMFKIFDEFSCIRRNWK
jgi:glycosyltransferase involved in cell wall biosynthesis